VYDGNVCNASGAALDAVMPDFLAELVVGHKLVVPLYYCKLGVIELEAGFLVQFSLHCPLLYILQVRTNECAVILTDFCTYLCVIFSLSFFCAEFG
jgi:hypothetical protein